MKTAVAKIEKAQREGERERRRVGKKLLLPSLLSACSFSECCETKGQRATRFTGSPRLLLAGNLSVSPLPCCWVHVRPRLRIQCVGDFEGCRERDLACAIK